MNYLKCTRIFESHEELAEYERIQVKRLLNIQIKFSDENEFEFHICLNVRDLDNRRAVLKISLILTDI